ncbi:MAG: DUF4349 domain-containing protein [Vulcanimicrobiota bacterium]
MKSHLLAIAAILLTATTATWAKQIEPNLKQVRVNLTLSTQDFNDTATRLQALARQHEADLQNLNLSNESASGSANIKLPPGRVEGFLKELASLGQIEAQNVYTSDNTSSYRDASQHLEAFRAMAKLKTDSLFAQLPEQQRLMVESEYQSYVRDRVRSYESNLESYRENGRWAEISLSFQKKAPSAPKPVAEDPTPAPAPAGEATVTPAGNSLLAPLYLLVLFNLMGLWAVHRKLDR